MSRLPALPSSGVGIVPRDMRAGLRSRGAACASLWLLMLLALAVPVGAQRDGSAMRPLDPAVALEGLSSVLRQSPAVVAAVESSGAEPLLLTTVLSALDRSHPELEAAARKLEAAEAKRKGADGVWDPYLSLQGKRTPTGYYRHDELDAAVQQATPLWGLRVYGGYRRGIGDYPDYKGELETLSGGEVRAGAELPLWKDGPIDPGRAEIERRSALESAARCGRDAVRLQVRRYAARAYWSWALAGHNVRIQSELLEVAKQRDLALREQVALGGSAAIAVTDNIRMLLEREAKFVAAQQQFDAAAVQLSLFYRDGALRPIVPAHGRVPERLPEVEGRPATELSADLERALARRPELCQLLGEQDAAEVELRLAENQRAPFVALRAQVARDMGTGSASLTGTELSVGVKIAMPLTLRKARGAWLAADAELAALRAQVRGLGDQMAAEIRRARIGMQAARRQLTLARGQLEAAQALSEAERQKLTEGASDLVVVNLREVAVAEAARMVAQSLVDLQLSMVDYQAALGIAP